MGTGETAYPGYHAIVVSAVAGHGDPELLQILPATTTADQVALVGMHDWTEPSWPAITRNWGLSVFGPDELRSTSTASAGVAHRDRRHKRSPSTSTSTPSTPTRSSSVSVPTSAA
jgi:hypothetical protein